MKTIKRLSSDWDIYSDTVTIYGNFVVVGKSTTVESVETLIYDNFVTLAAGQGGGSSLNAGIEIDRGTNPRVGIRWHEENSAWQYTNDGTIWKTFSRMIVEEDKNPRLGGDLVVQDSDGKSWTITSNSNENVVIYAGMETAPPLPDITMPDGSVILGPVIRLPQLTENPLRKNGYSSIYAKKPETGDTGLFVANDNTTEQELITKRKAFIYSIIF